MCPPALEFNVLKMQACEGRCFTCHPSRTPHPMKSPNTQLMMCRMILLTLFVLTVSFVNFSPFKFCSTLHPHLREHFENDRKAQVQLKNKHIFCLPSCPPPSLVFKHQYALQWAVSGQQKWHTWKEVFFPAPFPESGKSQGLSYRTRVGTDIF